MTILRGPSMMSQEKTTWKDTATEEIFQVKDAWKDQMFGCGAHVRIIAPPHVRCACGSAEGF